MEINPHNKIQAEREKLNQMIDDTIKNRIPLSKNSDIQQQGRFLEQLIEKANVLTNSPDAGNRK